MKMEFDSMQYFGIVRLPLYAILVLLFTLLAIGEWRLSRWWFSFLLAQAFVYLYQLHGLSTALEKNIPLVLPPAYTLLLLAQTGIILMYYVHSLVCNRNNKKGTNHGTSKSSGNG